MLVLVVPANMAVRAASWAAMLSSISCMERPSGGVLSDWPESRSLRISRSSNTRCAASSARFDTDELRVMSCVTAWRAASVSSGEGAAGCATGSSGVAISAATSVLTVSGRPLSLSMM